MNQTDYTSLLNRAGPYGIKLEYADFQDLKVPDASILYGQLKHPGPEPHLFHVYKKGNRLVLVSWIGHNTINHMLCAETITLGEAYVHCRITPQWSNVRAVRLLQDTAFVFDLAPYADDPPTPWRYYLEDLEFHNPDYDLQY